MGTRSLTVITDNQWQEAETKEVTVLYRQYDGYPSGHGDDLAELFRDTKIVNGIGRETANIANGMGCLAAQMVAHFKDGPGSFYLYPSGTRGYGEEYIYELYCDPNTTGSTRDIWLRVQSCYQKDLLYDGPISEFDSANIQEGE